MCSAMCLRSVCRLDDYFMSAGTLSKHCSKFIHRQIAVKINMTACITLWFRQYLSDVMDACDADIISIWPLKCGAEFLDELDHDHFFVDLFYNLTNKVSCSLLTSKSYDHPVTELD